jgi:nicotinamidase-related amidase
LDLIATPESLRSMLDLKRTALVVIDVQVDFAAADGAMAGMGADLSSIEPAIDRMAALVAAARARNVGVVWLRVVSHADTDSGAAKRLNARRGYPDSALAVCRDGERGSQYYRLAPLDGELEISKPLYSGFHGTRLDEMLRARDIDALLLVGLTTECCVDCTARDAFHRDYDVFIVSDACAAYGGSLHLAALDSLSKNCALLADSATTLQALEL